MRIKQLSIKLLAVILIMFAGLTSCMKDLNDNRSQADENNEINKYLSNNTLEVTPSWTGLYYLTEIEGKGETVQLFDTVSIKYTAELLDGTLMSTVDTTFSLGGSILVGLKLGISMMVVGESAKIIVPSSLAFGSYGYGSIEPYTPILYNIELTDLKKGITVVPYDITDITPQTTPSGLVYYEIEDGDGKLAESGQTVTVHYTGYRTSGRIFDSSVKRNEEATFVIGNETLIAGWEEGILLMEVGDKFSFTIPSSLAYGENGRVPFIPGETDLIFDIELIAAED